MQIYLISLVTFY